MFILVEVIFAALSTKYKKKWAGEKDRKRWEKWEEGEEIRRKMGHTTDLVKISRSSRPPRKKHRH